MEQEHSFWNRDFSIRSFDEEDRKEAAKHQTKKQQERGDDAEKRNVRGVESAQFSARQNQYRAAFDAEESETEKAAGCTGKLRAEEEWKNCFESIR